MFHRIVVPIDGSELSWRAFGPARVLAQQCGATLEVLEVVDPSHNYALAEAAVRERLADEKTGDVAVEVVVLPVHDHLAATIARHVARLSRAVVVISSNGRGRSAALLGSTTEALLREIDGPVAVVGPHSWTDRPDFSGQLVVAVDGSATSEAALPVAARWGAALRARPWVVAVAGRGGDVHPDVVDSAYPHRVADRLGAASHHEVEFEVLHDDHPAAAVARFADELGAAFVVAATHGRTGLARVRLGSVAMALVKQAPCPVVLQLTVPATT